MGHNNTTMGKKTTKKAKEAKFNFRVKEGEQPFEGKMDIEVIIHTNKNLGEFEDPSTCQVMGDETGSGEVIEINRNYCGNSVYIRKDLLLAVAKLLAEPKQ